MNTIKKAKLKSRSLEVELDEKVEVGEATVTNEVVKKCAALVSDDLIAAFDNLKKHMVKICDFKKSELITRENIEDYACLDLPEYSITGFSIGGNDEHEGVTLIGSRKFDSGKVLNIVTPFTKYDIDEYEFAMELASDIQRCVYEVEEYLNGKCAAKQMELAFDEEDKSDSGSEVILEKTAKPRKIKAHKEEAA